MTAPAENPPQVPPPAPANVEAPDRFSRPLLWVVMFLFVGLVCVGLAELVLRIVPGQWSNANAFVNVYDPDTGSWHLPSFSGDFISADYSIRGFHVNAFGMRDRERSLEKEPGVFRIAVLGDSFVEGLQVADDQTFTRKMEAELGKKVEVLNFGVGGFGTLQEKIAYEKKVRPFKPDLVILGFLSGNDMRNNSRELESLYNGGGRREMPFLVRQPDGSWLTDQTPPRPQAQNPVVLFAKRHFTLYRFLWYVAQRYTNLVGHGTAAASATGTSAVETRKGESVEVMLTRLSAPPEGQAQVFKDAWDATDKVLTDLRGEVEADGAKFMLVAFPSATQMYPDPRAALEKEYGQPLPKEYDPGYPERHLGELAAKEKFEYLDLTPAFREYRDANRLQPPYFSYAHDGHWSPLGHDLAAKTIIEELKKRNLLPSI